MALLALASAPAAARPAAEGTIRIPIENYNVNCSFDEGDVFIEDGVVHIRGRVIYGFVLSDQDYHTGTALNTDGVAGGDPMATTQPTEQKESSAAHSEAGWSLHLPDEDPTDIAATDDSPRDTDQSRSPGEEGDTIEGELIPDQGKRKGLEDGADTMEGDPA